MRQLVLGVLTCVFSVGCASSQPYFSPDIANAIAHDDMHKMESEQVELYYPGREHDAAVRTLNRLDRCLTMLRSHAVTQRKRPKAVVYLTSDNFNNAYVSPTSGGFPQHMVIPHHFTLDFFNWVELGLTNPGDVSCHESVHYVQMEQVDGFWTVMNAIFGNLLAPNVFTETWFLEGIATYYEGRLGHSVGRSNNPLWRSMFLSGIASRGGEVRAGDLNPNNRELLPFGGNYLAGMHFVEYLARTYGESKLWELIDLQGRSIFSPFWVSLRFRSVYGKTLSGLLDDFNDEIHRTVKDRVRPPEQQVLDPELGYLARIASSRADGSVASLIVGVDEEIQLRVRDADGRVRFSRPFNPFLPVRPFITGHPELASGLSFSADGRSLFVMISDPAIDGAETSRLIQVDARNGGLVRTWDLDQALGGSPSPDGRSYVYVGVDLQTANLMRLDLSSGKSQPLTHLAIGSNLGAPEYSPDGSRIVFAQQHGDDFDISMMGANGTIESLTQDPPLDYFPHWIDNDHVLFLRQVGDSMQVHTLDVATRALTQVSHAPFTAFDPVPSKSGEILFVNREAWAWTLDRIPATTGVPVVADAVAPSVPAEESETPATIFSDRRASPIDQFFVPTLHSPYVIPYLTGTPTSPSLGAVFYLDLRGSDRLGIHTYAASVTYDTADKEPSVYLSYSNYQLAPWLLSVDASRSVFANVIDWQGDLTASRPFWTNPVSLSLQFLQRNVAAAQGQPAEKIRFVGPSAGFSYTASNGTAYAGTREAISLSTHVSYFPKAFSSDFSILDLRGELLGYVPLPGLKRQTLRLDLRGRTLPGAPVNLLNVGGSLLFSGVPEFLGAAQSNATAYLLPPGIAFGEPLRGYEDFAVQGRSAVLFGAQYRYPFIIDRGFTSIFYLFPSLFFRQLELEAFFDGAYLDTGSFHRAYGGAVRLRTVIGGQLPISLMYQFSARLDDGLAPLHMFALAFQ